MSLTRQGGGGCHYYVCCFLAGTSKGETSSSKTLLRVLKAYERFQVFDMLQFLFKAPIKNPFCTAYCLIAHLFVCI